MFGQHDLLRLLALSLAFHLSVAVRWWPNRRGDAPQLARKSPLPTPRYVLQPLPIPKSQNEVQPRHRAPRIHDGDDGSLLAPHLGMEPILLGFDEYTPSAKQSSRITHADVRHFKRLHELQAMHASDHQYREKVHRKAIVQQRNRSQQSWTTGGLPRRDMLRRMWGREMAAKIQRQHADAHLHASYRAHTPSARSKLVVGVAQRVHTEYSGSVPPPPGLIDSVSHAALRYGNTPDRSKHRVW